MTAATECARRQARRRACADCRSQVRKRRRRRPSIACLPVPVARGAGPMEPRADAAERRPANSTRPRCRWCRPTATRSQCEALRDDIFAGKRAPLSSANRRPGWRCLIEALRLDADATSRRRRRRSRSRRSTPRPPRAARSTARRSTGWPTPTRASARCSKRSSTAATSGFRSRASRRIAIDAPADLRDTRLDAGQLHLDQRRQAVGLIPSRYAGTAPRRPTAPCCWRAAPSGSNMVLAASRHRRGRRPAHVRHRRRRHTRCSTCAASSSEVAADHG